MPKIVEQTVYTLEELKEINEKAYERACNMLAEWNTDLPKDFFDSTFDYIFEKYGIKDGKVHTYSYDGNNADVSYSCHFPCHYAMKAIAKGYEDLDARLLFNLIEFGFVEINAGVRHSEWQSMYTNADVLVHDSRLYNSKKLEELLDDLSPFLENQLEYLQDEIRAELESMLRKEYEYLQSEECVQEFAEANEYLFTEKERYGMAKYKIEHYHGSRGISTKTIESIEEVESSSVTEALKLCMREDWRIIEHSPSFASASNPECGSTREDVWIAEEQTEETPYE